MCLPDNDQFGAESPGIPQILGPDAGLGRPKSSANMDNTCGFLTNSEDVSPVRNKVRPNSDRKVLEETGFEGFYRWWKFEGYYVLPPLLWGTL